MLEGLHVYAVPDDGQLFLLDAVQYGTQELDVPEGTRLIRIVWQEAIAPPSPAALAGQTDRAWALDIIDTRIRHWQLSGTGVGAHVLEELEGLRKLMFPDLEKAGT